jgi:hypothetical protein
LKPGPGLRVTGTEFKFIELARPGSEFIMMLLRTGPKLGLTDSESVA